MPSRSHLPPSPISPTSGFLSQLYTRIIWFRSRSLDYRLSSIHVMSHLHPSSDIRFSPPSRLGINSIQLSYCTELVHLIPIAIPARSRCEYQFHLCSLFIYIQVTRFTSHLYLCCVSPQSMSWYLWLTSTQMMSQIHPGPISNPSRSWY